ncbi:hypothetical protein ACFWBF_35665 [Streptomyces sp. NPDC060028]|uniref:hypothetical protein n=1 Tax=Streptomyces sp. NPDC060028 TaxID=3347041 RepID=UPI0036771B43
MSNDPVDPAEIPVFTGNLAELETRTKALSGDGSRIATAGSDVHTTFGGLSAFYQAPEAEQLFAVTKPVVDVTASFTSDLKVISGALTTYAHDVTPLVKKLDRLRGEAAVFRTKVSREDKWREDGDLIEENLDRRDEVAEVWAQFQDAERACYNKIVTLFCGVPLSKDDGSHATGMYGYDAKALKASKSLPWGDVVEESVPAWQVWEHAWDFGKGVLVDGVWGTLKGLGTLVGVDGWDACKEAWTGLAKLSTFSAITSVPGLNVAFLMADDKDLPSWLRDSRTAAKETGKALLAWDEWQHNPSRAAGAVTFNVVTTIATGGTGGAASGAGKAGMAAKAISAAGKVGHVIDPVTYVFKGAGAGLSKISDVVAGFRGIGKIEAPTLSDGAFTLPEGAHLLPDGTVKPPAGAEVPAGSVKLPDGTVRLPDGTATLPPGTVKLPFEGPATYMDPDGNLLKADGTLHQPTAEAPTTNPTPTPTKVPEMAGVGARGGDTIHNGHIDPAPSGSTHTSDIAPTGGHTPGDPTPGGETHGSDGQPASHDGAGAPDVGSGNRGGSDGGDAGAHDPGTPDQPPVHLDGDRVAQQPTGKMAPEQEADLTAALVESKVASVDQGRMLTQLRKSEYGAAVAEYISSGRFAHTPGYRMLIFQVKQGDMMPAVHQALEHAAELQAKNMENIEFELKLPEEKLDLDVLARSQDGIEYGAQLKDVKSAKGIKSAVGGIAEKQLAGAGVRVKVAILDIHDVKGAMTEQIFKWVQRAADRTNASFELRFADGSVTVFPTNAATP